MLPFQSTGTSVLHHLQEWCGCARGAEGVSRAAWTLHPSAHQCGGTAGPLPGSRDGGDVLWPTKAPHRVTEGTLWEWAVLRVHSRTVVAFCCTSQDSSALCVISSAAAPRWKCLSNTSSSSWHWSPGKRSQALTHCSGTGAPAGQRLHP